MAFVLNLPGTRDKWLTLPHDDHFSGSTVTRNTGVTG